MYPENPEGTQVIVGSMNMEYISDTARNRAHNLFRPKREPIPLGHSDGQCYNGVRNYISRLRLDTPVINQMHGWNSCLNWDYKTSKQQMSEK